MHTRLFFVVFGLAIPLHAQSPREPKPDARRLQLGTDSLEVYLVRQGDRQRTGTIIDRLDTVRVDGELRLQRVYRRIDAALGNGVDTLVDRFPDLAPRRVRSRSDDGGTEILDWSSGRITGMVDQPGRPRRSIDTAVTPSVYSGASFDLVVRASPLTDKYDVAAPAYSGRRGGRTLTARVVGAEVLPGFGDAWRVDADYGGLSVTFWISKKSRRLLRQVVRVTPGTELLYLAPQVQKKA